MSMIAYTAGMAGQRDVEASTLDEWREDSSKLQNSVLLKRQQYYIDCSELDRGTRMVENLLDHHASVGMQILGLRELIEDFRTVIRRCEEKGLDTCTLRRKLLSLELRARAVHREMERQQRAHEFNERAIRAILRDYKRFRL